MKQLTIAAVGHVDHGKSTLLGRLLYETGAIAEERFAAAEARSRELGRPMEYAFLLDALEEEQVRNVTIDLCRLRFRTPKCDFVVIDAPGHKEFLKSMVSGAASADGVVLLVDAAEGIRSQTRRHASLLQLLGIRQVVVAINKMDRVGYAAERFERLRGEITSVLGRHGLSPLAAIPIAAFTGENVTRPSANLAWHSGPTLLEALEGLRPTPPPWHLPARFPVQDVYRNGTGAVAVGRLEAGVLEEGELLEFAPSGIRTPVEFVGAPGEPRRKRARAGEAVSIRVPNTAAIDRGEVGSRPAESQRRGNLLGATIFWLGNKPLTADNDYLLRLTTLETRARIRSIDRVVRSDSLDSTFGAQAIEHSEIAEVTLETDRPIPFDLFPEVPTTGRVVLIDGPTVAGGGILARVV